MELLVVLAQLLKDFDVANHYYNSWKNDEENAGYRRVNQLVKN
jgi:hypothetical protein